MGPRLVVVGAGGRMGRRIVALATESKRFEIIGAVDRADHPDIGKDVGVLAGVEKLNVALSNSWPAGPRSPSTFPCRRPRRKPPNAARQPASP